MRQELDPLLQLPQLRRNQLQQLLDLLELLLLELQLMRQGLEELHDLLRRISLLLRKSLLRITAVLAVLTDRGSRASGHVHERVPVLLLLREWVDSKHLSASFVCGMSERGFMSVERANVFFARNERSRCARAGNPRDCACCDDEMTRRAAQFRHSDRARTFATPLDETRSGKCVVWPRVRRFGTHRLNALVRRRNRLARFSRTRAR